MITRWAVEALYARALAARLPPSSLPRHVALVVDGNRRWARAEGLDNPSLGHRRGAQHIETALGWCADLGIRHVTVWVASADNIRKRDSSEVAYLMELVEEVIAARLGRRGSGWRVLVTGQLQLLPDSTRLALKEAQENTQGETACGELTIAIGYSGRAEVVDAVRSVLLDAAARGEDLASLAASVQERDITEHLDTARQPPVDLVIRTSGEQRLSDFLLWQGTSARLFFCDVYWPAFRRIDLLRALRDFARRTR